MKTNNLSLCLLLTGVWLAAPVVVSAEDLGGKGIFSYGSEMSKGSSWDKSGEREPHMGSYSDALGPSFDIPSSLKGDPATSDPWFGRRSSGDPSVKDLSRMDGGGFAPPGSYTGSERRF
ncbi:MAG: hypothetical protein H8K04_12155 [Nitrospira sp.]